MGVELSTFRMITGNTSISICSQVPGPISHISSEVRAYKVVIESSRACERTVVNFGA